MADNSKVDTIRCKVDKDFFKKFRSVKEDSKTTVEQVRLLKIKLK